ncbi:MAG: beta strand repeat-containing protein [Candidatus Spyradosoma sp.]
MNSRIRRSSRFFNFIALAMRARRAAGVPAFLLAAAALGVAAVPASAANVTVYDSDGTTVLDSGDTLDDVKDSVQSGRVVVFSGDASSGTKISFSGDTTLTLQSATPDTTYTVTGTTTLFSFRDGTTNKLYLTDLVFDGSGSNGFGSGGNLEIVGDNVIFQNMRRTNGGVFEGNTLKVSGAKFLNNSSEATGGALRGVGAIAVAGNNEFLRNASAQHGGAIGTWTAGATVSISGENTFSGNRSGFNGGVVSNSGTNGSVTLSGKNTFTNNVSGWHGGAIAATDAAGTITLTGENVFEANSAGYSGGAIYAGSNVSVSGKTTFTNNTANSDSSGGERGGAIYAEGNVAFSGDGSEATFSGNRRLTDDGAVVANDVYAGGNVSFSGTGTYSFGGGIVTEGTGALTISDGATVSFGAGSITNIAGELSLSGATLTIAGGNTTTFSVGMLNLGSENSVIFEVGEGQLDDDGETLLLSGDASELASSGAMTLRYTGAGAANFERLLAASAEGVVLTETEYDFTLSRGGDVVGYGNELAVYTKAGASVSVASGDVITVYDDASVSSVLNFSASVSDTLTLKSDSGELRTLTRSSGSFLILYGLHLSIENLKLAGGSGGDQYSGKFGGALSFLDKAYLSGVNAHFENNSVTNCGGAIFAKWSFRLDGTNTFVGNRAGELGGAIMLGGEDMAYTFDFSGTNRFERNSAREGGAISVEKVDALISGTNDFIDNQATSRGGAISAGGNVAFSGDASAATFSGNTANGKANDVYAGGNVSVSGTGTYAFGGGIVTGGTGALSISGGAMVSFGAGSITNIAGELSLSGATLTIAGGNTTTFSVGGGVALTGTTNSLIFEVGEGQLDSDADPADRETLLLSGDASALASSPGAMTLNYTGTLSAANLECSLRADAAGVFLVETEYPFTLSRGGNVVGYGNALDAYTKAGASVSVGSGSVITVYADGANSAPLVFSQSATLTLRSATAGVVRTITGTDGTKRFFSFAGSTHTLYLTDLVFDGNGSLRFARDNSGTLEIVGDNVTIRNMKPSEIGGAIYANNVVLSGTTTFTGNEGTYGGAVDAYESVALSGTTTFTNNTASTGNGGAIYAGRNVAFSGDGSEATFSGNTANGKANDVYAKGNVSFSGAGTYSFGGGIVTMGTGALSISDGATVTFADGAINSIAGATTISGAGTTVTFANDGADALNTFSGGLTVSDGATVKIGTSAATPAAAGTVTFAGDATLDFTGGAFAFEDGAKLALSGSELTMKLENWTGGASNALTLGAGTTLELTGAGAQTVGGALTLGGAGAKFSAGGALALGDVAMSGGEISATGDLTISGAITDAVGTGSASGTLSGANVTIAAGAQTQALGDAAHALALKATDSAAGTLTFTGAAGSAETPYEVGATLTAKKLVVGGADDAEGTSTNVFIESLGGIYDVAVNAGDSLTVNELAGDDVLISNTLKGNRLVVTNTGTLNVESNLGLAASAALAIVGNGDDNVANFAGIYGYSGSVELSAGAHVKVSGHFVLDISSFSVSLAGNSTLETAEFLDYNARTTISVESGSTLTIGSDATINSALTLGGALRAGTLADGVFSADKNLEIANALANGAGTISAKDVTLNGLYGADENAAATTALTAAGTLTLAGATNTSGNVTAGTLAVNGTATLSGTVGAGATEVSGTLALSGAADVSRALGTATLATGGTLNVDADATADVVFAADATGATVSLTNATLSGDATLTGATNALNLTGATITGALTASAGTLTLAGANSVGSASIADAVSVNQLAGSVLTLTSGALSVADYALGAGAKVAGDVESTGGAVSVAGEIDGALTLTDGADASVAGTGSVTGATTAQGGTTLRSEGSLGAVSVVDSTFVQNGGSAASVSVSLTAAGTASAFTQNTGTVSGNVAIDGAGFTQSAAGFVSGTLTLSNGATAEVSGTIGEGSTAPSNVYVRSRLTQHAGTIGNLSVDGTFVQESAGKIGDSLRMGAGTAEIAGTVETVIFRRSTNAVVSQSGGTINLVDCIDGSGRFEQRGGYAGSVSVASAGFFVEQTGGTIETLGVTGTSEVSLGGIVKNLYLSDTAKATLTANQSFETLRISGGAEIDAGTNDVTVASAVANGAGTISAKNVALNGLYGADESAAATTTLTATGTLTLAGTTNTSGAVAAGTLRTSGAATLLGDVNAARTYVSGTLTVGEAATTTAAATLSSATARTLGTTTVEDGGSLVLNTDTTADVYFEAGAANASITISGATLTGCVTLTGATNALNLADATITGALTASAGTINVSGANTAGRLAIYGAEVVLDAGASLTARAFTQDEDSTFTGDLAIVGGSARIAGTVNGGVSLTGVAADTNSTLSATVTGGLALADAALTQTGGSVAGATTLADGSTLTQTAGTLNSVSATDSTFVQNGGSAASVSVSLTAAGTASAFTQNTGTVSGNVAIDGAGFTQSAAGFVSGTLTLSNGATANVAGTVSGATSVQGGSELTQTAGTLAAVELMDGARFVQTGGSAGAVTSWNCGVDVAGTVDSLTLQGIEADKGATVSGTVTSATTLTDGSTLTQTAGTLNSVVVSESNFIQNGGSAASVSVSGESSTATLGGAVKNLSISAGAATLAADQTFETLAISGGAIDAGTHDVTVASAVANGAGTISAKNVSLNGLSGTTTLRATETLTLAGTTNTDGTVMAGTLAVSGDATLSGIVVAGATEISGALTLEANGNLGAVNVAATGALRLGEGVSATLRARRSRANWRSAQTRRSTSRERTPSP